MGGGRPRRGEPGGARVAACRDCWSPQSCASLATSPKPESPQPRHGTMAQTAGCTLAAWPAGLALPSSAGPQGGVAANLAHTSGHGSAWPPTHFGYCATRPKPLCPDHRAAQSRVLWKLPVFCRGPRKFRNGLQAGSLAPTAACPRCRCHSEAFPSKLLTAIKLCLETVYCRSYINCSSPPNDVHSSCATVGKTLLATHDSLRWLRAQPHIAIINHGTPASGLGKEGRKEGRDCESREKATLHGRPDVASEQTSHKTNQQGTRNDSPSLGGWDSHMCFRAILLARRRVLRLSPCGQPS